MNFEKKGKAILCFFFWLNAALVFSGQEQDSGVKIDARLEMGIDSLQQKYLRPFFRTDFPFSRFRVFGEVTFHQRAGDQLQGAIDYWLNFGIQKDFSHHFFGEIRLNHLCRHLSFRENPDIFNLNEVMARGWFRGSGIGIGLGAGTYTGGNQDYRSFLVFNARFPGLFGTELSFAGEIKYRDFQELLYELELSFALNKSTELFIRNARHYGFENTTFIGLRMSAEGKLRSYLDRLKLSTGFYTRDEIHKILVEAQYRMAFFKTDFRKLIFALDFAAPILRDIKFWGDFYPENMVYGFQLEYERAIHGGLFVCWTSRYNLDIPLDTGERFSSDLGTGIRLKNQTDFDSLDKPVRFEVSAGVNFTYDYDLEARLGFNLFRLKPVRLESDWHIRLNNTRFHFSFMIFSELGRSSAVRPFVRLDCSGDHGLDDPPAPRFLIGLNLIRWYCR